MMKSVEKEKKVPKEKTQHQSLYLEGKKSLKNEGEIKIFLDNWKWTESSWKTCTTRNAKRYSPG